MNIEETIGRLLDDRLRPIVEQLRRLNGSDDILTVEQTAELTGYSARTVRAHAKKGKLPGFKPSGSSEWRFRRSAVMAAMSPSLSRVDTETEARKIVAGLNRRG